MNICVRAWKHFLLITKHRFEVYKLCVKAGIPVNGLFHDLSKYGLTEFLEGAKYYTGYMSPITKAKIEKGFSSAYAHHVKHNKHHVEYWYLKNGKKKASMLPYKYAVELICDKIAAGKVYSGKDFVLSEPLEFYLKCKDREYINEYMAGYIEEVLETLSEKGIDFVVNEGYFNKVYNKYLEKERKNENENV